MIYLTRGFVTSHGCHWLYLVSVDSFLSVSDTRTWFFMFSCIFYSKIWGGLGYLIIINFHAKISQNLSLHFWHITFREPRIFPETKFCPGLWKYYILALSVSNFSPLNALFPSILNLFLVRLIMWEVLEETREEGEWKGKEWKGRGKGKEKKGRGKDGKWMNEWIVYCHQTTSL